MLPKVYAKIGIAISACRKDAYYAAIARVDGGFTIAAQGNSFDDVERRAYRRSPDARITMVNVQSGLIISDRRDA